MPAYGKGPAIGYTDYFKGKRRTPGATPEDEEQTKKDPVAKIPESKDERKAAIRRRLKLRKEGK